MYSSILWLKFVEIVACAPSAMPFDVPSMLRWSLPPVLIYIVLMVKFSGLSMRSSSLDFAEVFSGKGELSRALRQVSWEHLRLTFLCCCYSYSLNFSVYFARFFPASRRTFTGVSIDRDNDPSTQDLLSPGGFLFLG